MHLTTRTSIFFKLIKFYSRQNKQENQNLMIQVRTRECKGQCKRNYISTCIYNTQLLLTEQLQTISYSEYIIFLFLCLFLVFRTLHSLGWPQTGVLPAPISWVLGLECGSPCLAYIIFTIRKKCRTYKSCLYTCLGQLNVPQGFQRPGLG